MSHTPGPWIAAEITLFGGDTTWQIADAEGTDIPITRENVILAAAAPNLLAACEAAAEMIELDNAEGADRWKLWAQLDAAIKKAKGMRHE